MNITPIIKYEAVTTEVAVPSGFTLTLTQEEAAIISALAGDCAPSHARSYAVQTGRLDGGSTFKVATLLSTLAKIVPAK